MDLPAQIFRYAPETYSLTDSIDSGSGRWGWRFGASGSGAASARPRRRPLEALGLQEVEPVLDGVLDAGGRRGGVQGRGHVGLSVEDALRVTGACRMARRWITARSPASCTARIVKRITISLTCSAAPRKSPVTPARRHPPPHPRRPPAPRPDTPTPPGRRRRDPPRRRTPLRCRGRAADRPARSPPAARAPTGGRGFPAAWSARPGAPGPQPGHPAARPPRHGRSRHPAMRRNCPRVTQRTTAVIWISTPSRPTSGSPATVGIGAPSGITSAITPNTASASRTSVR